MVALTYGVGQGLGESFLFGSERYLLTDELGVGAARYTQIDAFANIPWQIKALYGMLSDSCRLCGLKRTPYVLVAGILGLVSGLVLCFGGNDSELVAAFFLVLANLSIALPDVMIDASAAERARTHPLLAADVQALCWGSLNALAFFGELAVGFLVDPEVLGSRGVFGVFASTASLGTLLPASFGWLGEKRRKSRHGWWAYAAATSADDDQTTTHNPTTKAEEEEVSVEEEEEKTPRSSSARVPVFLAAAATCAVSVSIGLIQLLYEGERKTLVEGCATVVFGAVLAVLLFVLLRRVTPRLAGAAVYIFLEGALQPSTAVIFQWSHDDGDANGNCSRRCEEDSDDCGWARERDYPCISTETWGYARATARLFGLVGVVLYNTFFSSWPYRRIFALGTTVYFLANLLDLVWVSRTNVALGVPDDVFLFGSEIIQPTLRKLHVMPVFVLAARLCPESVEATLFALLMGLSNFGATVGAYNGVALLTLFGVDRPRYHNISSFVFARTLMYLLPLLLVPVFVPAGGPNDDLLHDDAGNKGALELVPQRSTTPSSSLFVSAAKDDDDGVDDGDEHCGDRTHDDDGGGDQKEEIDGDDDDDVCLV